MKWLRLALSVVMFPVSLLWYRSDIQKHRIPVMAYWLVMTLYVVGMVWAAGYLAVRLTDSKIEELDDERLR